MGVEAKAGSRWRSAVCDTEVVVVRAPGGEIDLRCGGAPMVAMGTDQPGGEVAAGFDAGTQLGKRYEAAEAGLEVLASKGGKGSLSLGEELLPLKGAAPLPSSD